ncbi:hypothetical protein V6N12_057130 [Hibiscus sabdariffa]|uniref:Uncharacterized protein n=1 Tax=Hibiscus sabdariffa TaxID=183260 RepID=A0ABR2AWC2_9ROSI
MGMEKTGESRRSRGQHGASDKTINRKRSLIKSSNRVLGKTLAWFSLDGVGVGRVLKSSASVPVVGAGELACFKFDHFPGSKNSISGAQTNEKLHSFLYL